MKKVFFFLLFFLLTFSLSALSVPLDFTLWSPYAANGSEILSITPDEVIFKILRTAPGPKNELSTDGYAYLISDPIIIGDNWGKVIIEGTWWREKGKENYQEMNLFIFSKEPTYHPHVPPHIPEDEKPTNFIGISYITWGGSHISFRDVGEDYKSSLRGKLSRPIPTSPRRFRFVLKGRLPRSEVSWSFWEERDDGRWEKLYEEEYSQVFNGLTYPFTKLYLKIGGWTTWEYPVASKIHFKDFTVKILSQEEAEEEAEPENTSTELKIEVTSEGKPLSNFNIEVKNDKKKKYIGKTDIKDISPGKWKVKVWSRGYIPYEKEITVEKDKINRVDVDLKKFTGIIFRVDSYYKSALNDVKRAKIEEYSNLKRLTGHIYILPEGHDRIYFGMVYKVGYPKDKLLTYIFAEDTYSVYAKVVTMDDHLVFSDSFSRGKNIKNYSIDDFYKNASDVEGYKIRKPTMLKVTLKAKADKEKEERFIIWVFPSNWNGYEKEAIVGVMLYSLKDNLGLFSYPKKARNYLMNEAQNSLQTSALNNIVWYGMSSMDFLKGALGIPDFGIFDIGQTAFQEYIDYKIESKIGEYIIAEEEGVYNKRKMDILSAYRDYLIVGITGEVTGAISSVMAAGDWAKGMSAVIQQGVEKVIAGAILRAISEKDDLFLCMVHTLTSNSVKNSIKQIRYAIYNNRPSSIETHMEQLSKCFVDIDETNKDGCDASCHNHPLSLVFAYELARIYDWKSGTSWPSFSEDLLSGFTVEQKSMGSKIAMKIYEPIIKTFMYISAPIIDACIIYDNYNTE